MQTNTRNATLADLAVLLQDRQARKVDVVATAPAFRSHGGVIVVDGTEPILTDDGVTSADGHYRPTQIADEGLAEKLGVPVRYLKRLRAERPDLYDANVNGWLHGGGWDAELDEPKGVGADGRSFLLRAFRGDDGGEGVLRAVLSDSYGFLDDIDVLTAALDGVRQSGAEVEVRKCALTDRRMYVSIEAPAVAVVAEALLDGYRSPFTGNAAADNPLVHAGFRLVNSEVGNGAFTLVPEITVQVCDNGMTMTRDAMRAVHLGGKLDQGLVKWTADTDRKRIELVAAQARDAVATFLDAGYVERIVAELTESAGRRVVEPVATVERVGKRMGYTAEQTAGVLDHFIRGGAITSGGVLHAVTSYAQTIEDVDTAWEFQQTGVDAMLAAVG